MFSFVFLIAAATTPVTPADGAYMYALSIAGMPAGKTTIKMAHTPGGVQVAESGSASYGGSDFSGTATLDLDAALAPAVYKAVYNQPARTIHVALAFKGSTATETDDSGNSETFILGQNTSHFAVLDGTLFAGVFILPSQLRAWNTQAFTAVSPMFGHGGAITIDAALRADRPKDVSAADVSLSVSDPLQFTIWYDPATLIVDELDVPAQSAAYVRLRTL